MDCAINKNGGFTLIELLVVITIVAVLSAIGLTVYSEAQKSARVAKRIEDLKAIKTALEVYRSRNGSYPKSQAGCVTGNTAPCSWRSECTTGGNHAPNDVIPGLVPQYLVAFPQDPQMDDANNLSCYFYQSNGNDYKLLDHCIKDFNSSGCDSNHGSNKPEDYLSQRNLVDPRRDNGDIDTTVDGTRPWSWAVWSPGAIGW